MTQNYIGVDLSKDWHDIFDPRTGHARVPNTAPARCRHRPAWRPPDRQAPAGS
ncbi:hypothetical protein ACSSV4_001269 [Roseovarius sp. MBR-154]